MKAYERLLNYVVVRTPSDENSETVPSSACQFDLARLLEAEMKELGLEFAIKGVSWDDLYPHQFTDPVVWGWGTNAPIETYNLFYSKGTGNYACYENAATDAYLDEALACPKVEDSFDLWKKAQWDGTAGVTQDGDIPWIWLVNIDHLYWSRDGLKVAEQKIHPHGHGWSIVNNVDQWSWE